MWKCGSWKACRAITASFQNFRYAHLLNPVRLLDWEDHVRRNDLNLAARYEGVKEKITTGIPQQWRRASMA